MEHCRKKFWPISKWLILTLKSHQDSGPCLTKIVHFIQMNSSKLKKKANNGLYCLFKECLSLPPTFSIRGGSLWSLVSKEYYFYSKRRPTTACMTSSWGYWACLQFFLNRGRVPNEVPWARITNCLSNLHNLPLT